MKRHMEALVGAYLAAHHGVIGVQAARELGMTTEQIEGCVRSGRWERLHHGVFALAGAPSGPETRLRAACVAAGPTAAASHASAAWLWGLVPTAPARPSVTVPRGRDPRHVGVDIHRRADLDRGRVIVRRSIPVTDPIRTLVDLGEVVADRALADAVDRALATRLLEVTALQNEIDRLGRKGRGGVARLRATLDDRGLLEAPNPSVLESRVLRLLRRWGIRPEGVEVVAGDGRYRLDVLLAPGIALEVDGYAFHWSPASKAADSRRRNELRLAGFVVVEADWITVMRDPAGLRATLQATLRARSFAG